MPARANALEAILCGHRSIAGEYRIFGPPGTGKTTTLTSLIHGAVDRYGPKSVLITSFSRAAAVELVGKQLPVGSGCVGTLHSICWNALGRPKIAEANPHEWNRLYPRLRITSVRKDRKLSGEMAEEEDASEAGGDLLLSQLNRTRSMMLPRESWPAALRNFEANWTAYKRTQDALDFCDLIDAALHDIEVAPNAPAVIFVDEAQDLNPMQLLLIRKWGVHAEYFVLAGDDDQTVYGWCGATPEGILDPDIPDDHKIFLRQSHRVPRKVHARADRLIHQVSRRQEKLYDPRPEDGACLPLSGGYKSPEYSILKSLEQHVRSGQSMMLLASCSYMLEPLIAVLKKQGIPFHNPYRKSNGFWNPLKPAGKDSATARILALLADPLWSYPQLRRWTEWIKPEGILKPEATTLLEQADDSSRPNIAFLYSLFEDRAIADLQCASSDPKLLLNWYDRCVAPEHRASLRYPISVAWAGGRAALEETPKVIIGTIHSVKGGQADVVYLFPDLSRAGDAAYQMKGSRDAIIRLFYVGMTRVRHTLYLCQPESSRRMIL